ncbi:hypothetical protein F5Y11DRAFT_181096 [Daldinia sp. FL1419]|nr:hypothetical protein F5Y11DRAFT_181096 [Daldinia sp. FL1419]
MAYFSDIVGFAMLLATAPFAVAHQSQPTCFPIPVALDNNTAPTPTINNTLIVDIDTNSSNPSPSPSARPELRIIDSDPLYKYVGCWSEVTLLNPDSHSLDGPFLTAPGLMNVHVCVDFCRHAANKNKGGNQTGYHYAGLEFAYQCWCGDNLSKHSYHLIDDVCDLPCAGANTTVCGGHLALTLYNVTEKKGPGDNNGFSGNGTDGSPGKPQEPDDDEAALQAVGVGILVLAVTFALGCGLL